MIRCLFLGHKWGPWHNVIESLTVGSYSERICSCCMLVEHREFNISLKE